MRAKATNETVLEAIRELIGGGDPDPSLEDIVALIGGSKTTVQKIVNANLGVIDEIREQALPMPTSVRDLYRNTALATWAGAEREARLKLRDESDQFAKFNQSLQDHLDSQIEVNFALASAVKDRDAEITTLRAELQTSRDVSRDLRSLADDLRHRLDRALAASAARDDLLTTLKGLGVGRVTVDVLPNDFDQTATAPAPAPTHPEPEKHNFFEGAQLDIEAHLAAAPAMEAHPAAETGERVAPERAADVAPSSDAYRIASEKSDLSPDA